MLAPRQIGSRDSAAALLVQGVARLALRERGAHGDAFVALLHTEVSVMPFCRMAGSRRRTVQQYGPDQEVSLPGSVPPHCAHRAEQPYARDCVTSTHWLKVAESCTHVVPSTQLVGPFQLRSPPHCAHGRAGLLASCASEGAGAVASSMGSAGSGACPGASAGCCSVGSAGCSSARVRMTLQHRIRQQLQAMFAPCSRARPMACTGAGAGAIWL